MICRANSGIKTGITSSRVGSCDHPTKVCVCLVMAAAVVAVYVVEAGVVATADVAAVVVCGVKLLLLRL